MLEYFGKFVNNIVKIYLYFQITLYKSRLVRNRSVIMVWCRLIGLAAWENYPTLRCLMEMVMTNNFRYPPPTMAVDEKTVEEMVNHDKQVSLWKLTL